MSGSDGPGVVAIGGGHGTAVTLRAATRYTNRVTAIVSVADDGGSSGRLRELLDVVALGDMRKCLVALADENAPLAKAFERRFEEGELAGHALGNLLLAGLVGATGDLVLAVDEAARVLGAAGRVLPATTEPVVLKADCGGGEVAGQVAVSLAGQIRSVSLVPGDAGAPPAAVEAILGADQVVIGPGSLYTSVLAAAAVPELAAAIGATTAQRVLVCNLRPQVPETEGYDVGRHVSALEAHGIPVDLVLCDTSAGMELGHLELPVTDVRLTDPAGRVHDPGRLAQALAGLLG
ncbi:MAG TPA: uridine diphosphate-N-acetylglucosamine-binding protein YvcK [Acidimicrobiales bacterium]|nr:uridine diphosphate-N-acetylglucosamine-binding protein YvcK [Acidimicrobiales bacterium]